MRLVLHALPELATVVVETGPLVPRPFDSGAWRAHVVGAGEQKTIVVRTRDGWPVEIVDCGERIVALYALLDYVAYAVVRGAELARHRPEIDELLLGATVDWSSSEIVALAQLWE